MTGWLIVLAAALVFVAVIWWWHWLDCKHMRDSIREANAHIDTSHPAWADYQKRKMQEYLATAPEHPEDFSPQEFLRRAMAPKPVLFPRLRLRLRLINGFWLVINDPRVETRKCPYPLDLQTQRAYAAAAKLNAQRKQATMRDLTWSDS